LRTVVSVMRKLASAWITTADRPRDLLQHRVQLEWHAAASGCAPGSPVIARASVAGGREPGDARAERRPPRPPCLRLRPAAAFRRERPRRQHPMQNCAPRRQRQPASAQCCRLLPTAPIAAAARYRHPPIPGGVPARPASADRQAGPPVRVADAAHSQTSPWSAPGHEKRLTGSRFTLTTAGTDTQTNPRSRTTPSWVVTRFQSPSGTSSKGLDSERSSVRPPRSRRQPARRARCEPAAASSSSQPDCSSSSCGRLQSSSAVSASSTRIAASIRSA